MDGKLSEVRKIGLPMVARGDARLFILGSLPGDASLSASRYYAYPTNQFWRLLGGAIGEDLQQLDYDARLDVLARRRIGLWDVICAARRSGSLDQAIREAEHVQLDRLIADFPQLQAVAFNGLTASAAGRRLLTEQSAIAVIDLPSSSAANTAPFALKAERWAVLRDYCADYLRLLLRGSGDSP